MRYRAKVLIYCTLLITNPTNTEKNLAFSANFENDVKIGLLKEGQLVGYQTDLKTNIFTIDKGENWIDVVFLGEYAGTNKKYDRLLPNIQIDDKGTVLLTTLGNCDILHCKK